MMQLLFLLLGLCQLNTIARSESTNFLNENYDDNLTNEEQKSNNDDSFGLDRRSNINTLSLITTNPNKTELTFQSPISAVSIDSLRNTVVLHFEKSENVNPKLNHERVMSEEKRRRALDQNFMRFGRSGSSGDFMRFGKRKQETYPKQNTVDSDDLMSKIDRFERNNQPGTIRDSRSDNFMRFGRKNYNLMRFGRAGNNGNEFMRFGRNPNFMRLGRNAANRVMRFDTNKNFMRFGRTKLDGMRNFIIRDNPYSRYGRTDSFMRFGRDPPPAIDNSNFMRFGKKDNATTTTSASVGEQPSKNVTNKSGLTDLTGRFDEQYQNKNNDSDGYNSDHNVNIALDYPNEIFE